MAEQLDLPFNTPGPSLKQLWSPDDIYENLNATIVAVFAEDRRVERKSAAVQPRALGDYLSMWSNTQPNGGIILVGVDDSGVITGCSKMSQAHKNALENLSVYCENARWESKVVRVTNVQGNEDYVLAFRVHYRPDRVVETSSGDAYIREGDKRLRIGVELKRELQIAKGEIHYELEAVPLVYPQDFDLLEVERFSRLYYAHRNFKQAKSTVELLELAKLGKQVKGAFKPNLACCLLLSKDPRSIIPGARIRIIRYEGTTEKFGEEQNSVFSEFVDGPVPQLLEMAKERISTQIRSYQKLTASGRLERRSEYPEAAWFEAVVNAVAHRSYNFKTQNIFVKIFDDKMVVESPGGFVPPTTAETVYDAHNPRNPNLMEAMMHLDLTFCGFEGTRRMRTAMINAQLPEPQFSQVEASTYKVTVTLQNDIEARKVFSEVISRSVSEEVYENLSKEERSIIRYLSTNNAITVRLASKITGTSPPTAGKILNSLTDQRITELAESRGSRIKRPKTYSLRGGI